MMRAFWKVTRYARAARFWLLLALAALAWLGFGGEARAQSCASGLCTYDTRPEALAGCQASMETAEDWYNANNGQGWTGQCVIEGNPATSTTYRCGIGSQFYSCTQAPGAYERHRWTGDECPAGTAWDNTTGKCECPNGEGKTSTGACESCASRNSQPGFLNAPSRSTGFSATCAGGCWFELASSGGCVTLGGVGGGAKMCSGTYEWSGQSCRVPIGAPAPDPIPDPPKKQECTQAGDGQTFCVKPNGDNCATATNGKQICWKPGETGSKGDGPVLQVRGPGTTTPPPPAPQTPAGDVLTPRGTPITATNTPAGSGTPTTTTTIMNYGTEFGTDAKPDNSGEPADGSGGSSGGSDDEDGTSADGGGDCDTPPIVNGDAALNMVANQAWSTRCAVEAGNAATVSGDVGDCKAPFSVEGTNANAEKLRAMRAQICGAESIVEGVAEGVAESKGDMDSEADALMPGEGDSVFATGGDVGSISSTMFGGGGGSCPLVGIGIPGIGVIDTTGICSALAALRLLFLAIATIWALRIVGGQ